MTQFQISPRGGIPSYGRYQERDFAISAPYFFIEEITEQTARTGADNHAHAHPYLYQMSWVASGAGDYDIEKQVYPLAADHFYLLAPGAVHACSGKENVKGYLMHFSPAFLSAVVADIPSLSANISELNFRITAGAKDREAIENLFQLLLAEFAKNGANGLVRQYVKLILLLFERQVPLAEVYHERGTYNALYSQFLYAVQKHVYENRKLSFYTDLLHTSARQLDRACQAAHQQTAAQIIRGVLLSKAEQLLKFSNKTIAEIAEELGFSEVSYFRKYIYRYLGVSASEYRKRLREKNDQFLSTNDLSKLS